MKPSYSFKLVMVFITIGVPLEAVTVNPALCPTNKIAPHPHWRSAAWAVSPRTFGAFYDLLSNQQFAPQSSLQEEPQKDELGDCGEIEDYDENDLTSPNSEVQVDISDDRSSYRMLTAQSQRRYGYDSGRLLFGHLFHNNPQHGQYPDRPTNPNRPIPVRPNRPIYPAQPTSIPPSRPTYPPVRPPYWSGGYFGNNPYRPPLQQDPSESVKPVHEDSYHETEVTYRPDVVGGPSGHVVGVRPTRLPATEATSSGPLNQPTYVRFPEPTQASATVYTTRRPRPRKLSNDGIFGSFIDLLFK